MLTDLAELARISLVPLPPSCVRQDAREEGQSSYGLDHSTSLFLSPVNTSLLMTMAENVKKEANAHMNVTNEPNHLFCLLW